MDFNDNANLFEDVPVPDAGGSGENKEGGADETAILHQRDFLLSMDKEALIRYIDDLHQHYLLMERDVSFLTWEFREYKDSLTLFSRAARLAHKMNASDLDIISSTATQEIQHYFHCDYAALFLYNLERMRFELCRSSAPAPEEDKEFGRDNFLGKLFTGNSYPCLAEYDDKKKIIRLDNGKTVIAEVPESWIRLLGRKALIFPLRVKQPDSQEPLTLGGLIIGDSRRELEAKDAEMAVIFGDILSGGLHNAQLVQKLNDLTIIDPLTQIYNRRHLINQLDGVMLQANRQGHPLSIAMVDIDHFKPFNDRYGHICGDEMLREVASTLKACVRAGVDVPARYGGEEFVLVMPFTTLDKAMEIAERVQKSIGALRVPFEGRELTVTCSFGLAAFMPGETLEHFIDRADSALYQAKRQGRNRVSSDSGFRFDKKKR